MGSFFALLQLGISPPDDTLYIGQLHVISSSHIASYMSSTSIISDDDAADDDDDDD